MSHRKHYNILNIIFFAVLSVISIAGPILLYMYSTISWQTWTLAGGMFVLCGLSITAGYHRLFSHKTHSAALPVRLFGVLFGSATFEGSVLNWSTDHRNHHRYIDTEKDPYNIKQGFWHAHMGWIFTIDESKRDYSNVDDLQQSRLLRLQHKYYTFFSVTMGFILPTAIAALWGEALAGFIIAGALRVTLGHHSTFCINSLCHVLGKNTYSNRISARDNWLSALVTFGEGYHNYHHQFSLDYRNGVRWYQFDPGKWFIFGLSCIGLTSNLRRIPDYRIIQARVDAYKSLNGEKEQPPLLEQLQESILLKISAIKEFEKASNIKEYTAKIKAAKKELYALFDEWKILIQNKKSLA